MVLNKHNPYSSDEEEEQWELISREGEQAGLTTPLASAANASHENPTEEGAEEEGEPESDLHLKEEEEDANDEHVEVHDGRSVGSGVSSITRDHDDHHTISDVEEEEDDDNKCDAPAPDGEHGKNKCEESSDDPLVEQISQMGFEKEQIEKAIGDLREKGTTEIDADSVIGSMMGEETHTNNNADDDHPTNPFQVPLMSTWDFVESTVQGMEDQHQLRRRTQNCVNNISRSAQELWSNVKDESQRFKSNVHAACDQADGQVRNSATQVRYAASTAKESICRANEEYRISEKVAAVAVIGGATLLALGNPRAGVGAMAVAGASLAAGEAMKHSADQSGSTYARDYGLRRDDVHLD